MSPLLLPAQLSRPMVPIWPQQTTDTAGGAADMDPDTADDPTATTDGADVAMIGTVVGLAGDTDMAVGAIANSACVRAT